MCASVLKLQRTILFWPGAHTGATYDYVHTYIYMFLYLFPRVNGVFCDICMFTLHCVSSGFRMPWRRMFCFLVFYIVMFFGGIVLGCVLKYIEVTVLGIQQKCTGC